MSANLTVIIFSVTVLAFLAGLYGERWRARDERKKWWSGKRAKNGGAQPPGRRQDRAAAAPATDATEQLRVVMSATFERKPLMSRSEAKMFYAAERAIRIRNLSWRVMAQVNLGEILSSPNSRAFAAINSKRVDVLLVTSRGDPIAAIEFQGEGHYQGTAPARDAVKKEALRRAGIRYIEMTPEHDAEDLAREIARIPTPDPTTAARGPA